MLRILLVSLFAAGLLVSGCRTERSECPHKGCHKIGPHRAGRNSNSVHHHYATPPAPGEAKSK